MIRLLSIGLFFISLVSVAQVKPIIFAKAYDEDSLLLLLNQAPKDTSRLSVLLALSANLYFRQPQRSLEYSLEALEISRQINLVSGIQNSLYRVGEARRMMGDFISAMKMQLELLDLSHSIGDLAGEGNAVGFIGLNYFELQHYETSINYLRQSLRLLEPIGTHPTEILFLNFLGNAKSILGQNDSAFFYLKLARKKKYRFYGPQLKVLTYNTFGDVFLRSQKADSAMAYYRRALALSLQNYETTPNHLCSVSTKLALLLAQVKPDSALYLASRAYQIAKKTCLDPRKLEASRLLATLYRRINMPDSAFFYQDMANATNESIYGKQKLIELQALVLNVQQKNQQIERDRERSQTRIVLLSLSLVLLVALIAWFGLFRSNRSKQIVNQNLQTTLSDLKATQSQLIHSEKMASLGELTAGIAHEIQNPLNFVNNFSEINKDLLQELRKELVVGRRQSAEEIVDSIQSNSEKINHHGKRADAIVKSMLQHSRTSAGQKELTDLNALCDEYLRLSYHGFRAKDKSFNAKFEVHLDESLPKIKIVHHDIGRVLLNLINNAFYAVNERAKKLQVPSYDPQVVVSTKNLGDKVEISIKDNGQGIPDSIKEKIFQPFFTTKPTGQGTGLGLSITYDIVKAQGGEVIVETQETQGTTFLILLKV